MNVELKKLTMEKEEEEEEGFADNDGKKSLGKKPSSGRDTSPPRCQADKCGVDLSDAKRYHRRHRVCQVHAKAPMVIVAALRQRFCQQCSRFHELMEFDETKRSCRRRLAGHNERRRKNSGELLYGEGRSCKAVVDSTNNERGGGVDNRMVSHQGNSTSSNYNKHFQIRYDH